ncbi:DUF397 domain-containing protein [Actinomadura hibisca]|uniref:DUF397 domain-containing protein n=1 Tax=Actinomadura hibisca TaxID=68565 RepID=UPI00082FF579|nr:DUF397 domain-containing protein [Actinomadura hibisca]
MDLSTIMWRKSRRSSEQGDQCVEVASTRGIVAVRDSKDPEGPGLLLARDDFRRFTSAIKIL